MESNNKKSFIIGIMLLIIIVLLVIIMLFLTNVISLNANKNVDMNANNESANNNIVDNSINSNGKSSNVTPTYKSFNVGDEITFNNEKWNVIKDSGINQDYVTVLKSEVLNKNMAYYETDGSLGSKLYNEYEKSSIKKYLENTYQDTLGVSNLKKIDGYTIRLITLDEMISLGCKQGEKGCINAPSWLTQSKHFWTMTMVNGEDEAKFVWAYSNGFGEMSLETDGAGSVLGVRPVINLLKLSIK